MPQLIKAAQPALRGACRCTANDNKRNRPAQASVPTGRSLMARPSTYKNALSYDACLEVCPIEHCERAIASWTLDRGYAVSLSTCHWMDEDGTQLLLDGAGLGSKVTQRSDSMMTMRSVGLEQRMQEMWQIGMSHLETA